MYKVLLVDDEKIVLESLKGSLDWEQHGFVVCGTAENGAEALEQIQSIRPEVVFTDIRMPGISGLELIKKAREISDCALVIVSGIAEFSYAQKAIKFGLEGYCLKPFDEEEIVSILSRIRNKLDREAEVMDSEFVWRLTEKQSEEKLKILEERLSNLGFAVGEGFLVCIIRGSSASSDWSELTSRFKTHIHFATGSAKHAIVVANSSSEALMRWMKEKIHEYSAWSAGWHFCSHLANLHQSFELADIAAYQYFLDSTKRFHSFLPTDASEINHLLKELKESIYSRNFTSATTLLERSITILREHKGNIQSVLRLSHIVISNLDDECFATESYMYSYEELAKHDKDLSACIEKLKDRISAQALLTEKESEPAIDHANLKKIIADVDRHFTDSSLSVRELSERYFVHPNYLSQLFKKHLGETFTEYITKKRIQSACHLLQNTELSIRMVGDSCGYPDYFHFAKIFKKITGFTPSIYRGLKHE